MSEVRILRHYYPSLEDVRCLSDDEIMRILDFTSRPMGQAWRIINRDNYDKFRLSPGHGMLCYLNDFSYTLWAPGLPYPDDEEAHTVALWRGYDGEFVLFDPLGFDIPEEIEDAVIRSGGTYADFTRYRTQGYGLGTCTYYCLAFMDYATRLRYPSSDLLYHFYLFMGRQSDERAVNIVQRIIETDGLDIDIRGPTSPDMMVQLEEDAEELFRE